MQRNDGFTIAELLVGMTLAAIAGVVLFNVFVSTQGAYYESRDITSNQAELRIVMGMMTQEIRSAGSDAQDLGVNRLGLADGGQFTVQSDLNGDGAINAVNEPAEQVTYLYDQDAETLTRRTGAGDVVILDNVTAFQVTYLDAAGDALGPLPLDQGNRELVRAIAVTITVDPDNDDVERTWSTTVAIRNDPRGV